LYSLKQTGCIWNQEIHSYLIEQGWTQSKADPCIYFSFINHQRVIIGLYVDDFIVGGTPAGITSIQQMLSARFEIKDLGRAKYILGIQITQEHGTITLSQRTYVENILSDMGLSECKPAVVPISGGDMGDIDTTPEPHDSTEYRNLLGRVTYAMTHTRPDIAFAVGYLGRFSANPTKKHWQMLLKLCRYLKGTVDKVITYTKGEGILELEGYVDAAHADCIKTRRSTGGYLITINGAPLSWQSKRQSTVATSTTEAEYMSAFSGTKEVIWLRELLKELGHPQEGITTIWEDNQPCISLSKDPSNHQKSKHFDVTYHFLRERVQMKQVELVYVPTTEQVADIMTKALPGPAFRKLLAIVKF